MSDILRIEHLKKNYGTVDRPQNGLDDICLNVARGEFVGIMGASGSGKTTLLNCISTIDFATSGQVFINGSSIDSLTEKERAKFRRDKLGFIFQDFNLLDTLTVEENITLALTINRFSSKEIRTRLQDIATKLNISDLLHKYPYEISGGEKQRCACARAMINQPDLILADEPTGALDSGASAVLMEMIRYINESQNATIMLVTHDVFVASYSKRLLFIKDGRICDELQRDDMNRSAYLNKIVEKQSEIGGGLECISSWQ